MSRTFRICCFLMITLMTCRMGTCDEDSCEQTCKDLCEKSCCNKRPVERQCQETCKGRWNLCENKCKDLCKEYCCNNGQEDSCEDNINESCKKSCCNNGQVERQCQETCKDHLMIFINRRCQSECHECLNGNASGHCSDLCFGVCSPCSLSKTCTQILLFAGGFNQQIQSTCNNSNDTSTCRDIYNRSSPFNNSTCILSFDTQENAKNESMKPRKKACEYSDYGVWLINNTHNSGFKINITRDKSVRPTAPICFVKGCHNCDWTKDTARTCSQPGGSSSMLCDNVTCVDPKTICKTAQYNTSCGENDTNDDIIVLNGSSAVCYKCGNAFKQTEGQVKINVSFPGSNSGNSSTSFREVMNRLNEMVLNEMGNKTSVSVSLDNITGIFVKQQKQDLNAAYFMYSRQTDFNIIEDETQLPTFNKTFSVPKEAFEKVSNLNKSDIYASLFRFPRFSQDSENIMLLNNEVYSLDMAEAIANLTETFNLTFRNINPDAGTPSCSSWDGNGSSPNWTTDGCNTSYVNGTVTCACQHLTFFAVLMSIPPTNISVSDLNNLTYITSIGCGLSLFFISIALFMHYLLRRGQASISVHILINLFLALFLLNLSFLSNQAVANTGNVIGCKFMAGVMHYSMLSTFTWFGLQALHLCLQLTQNVASIQHYVTKLSVAGWVPPALVVTVVFICQKYNKEDIVSDMGQTTSMCWITDPNVHYVVNIGYYCAIFLFTLLTFVVMLRWLWLLRSKRPTIKISGKKSRPSDALTIMGLCCILGLSWGFAFFAYGPLQIPAFYIFTILNSFQGFFLFIYYYKSSRLIGEGETQTETNSLATEDTAVENPYTKRKQF